MPIFECQRRNFQKAHTIATTLIICTIYSYKLCKKNGRGTVYSFYTINQNVKFSIFKILKSKKMNFFLCFGQNFFIFQSFWLKIFLWLPSNVIYQISSVFFLTRNIFCSTATQIQILSFLTKMPIFERLRRHFWKVYAIATSLKICTIDRDNLWKKNGRGTIYSFYTINENVKIWRFTAIFWKLYFFKRLLWRLQMV